MEGDILEADKRIKRWLPLVVTVAIALFIDKTTELFYKPYLPAYDPAYNALSETAALERAQQWVLCCMVVSYVLHTRRINRAHWIGKLSYWLMWLLYVYLLLYIIQLWIFMPNLSPTTEPMFG